MSNKEQAVQVYQLRVWIREISPQIWRRLLVRSDSTIAQLHDTLQIAFGWTDEHLHQFLIRGKPYGTGRSGGISFDDNPHQIRLCDFHFCTRERWVYEYDLNNWWQHEIRLEQVLPLDLAKRYPVCLAGKRPAAPMPALPALSYLQGASPDRCANPLWQTDAFQPASVYLLLPASTEAQLESGRRAVL